MSIFITTISQLSMMLLLVATGFFLRKKQLLPSDAHVLMSRLETLVFLPALNFSTQITQCTVSTFKENAPLILYGIPIICAAIALSIPLSRLFVKKNETSEEKKYERNVYKYALSLANYGFVGNFIILGVWGSEVFYKYSLFTFSFAPISLAWGLFLLTPHSKSEGAAKNLKRIFLSPPLIAMVLGMICGLLGLSKYIPDFFSSALQSVSSCMGPVAMLITGFVVGGFDTRSLFLNKKSYVISSLRLIFIPVLILSVLKLFGASDELLILALVAFATPVGLYTIIFPAAYGGETRHGASLVMLSQLLSAITIPLMYLIFIVPL